MSRKLKFSKEEIQIAVSSSRSLSEAVRVLRENKILTKGANHKTIKSYIKKYNIDTQHFYGKGWLKGKTHSFKSKNHKSFSDILIESSDYLVTSSLKKKLLKHGLLENKCYIKQCPLNESNQWIGSKIVFHLDHINGISDDNRIENLRLLCPNCHSQTSTYVGKNKGVFKEEKEKTNSVIIRPIIAVGASPKSIDIKYHCKCGKEIKKRHKFCLACYKEILANRYKNVPKQTKINWPSKEELFEMVWKESSSQLSKKLGVSDTAIKKQCRKYGIEKPPRGYWAKQKSLQDKVT